MSKQFGNIFGTAVNVYVGTKVIKGVLKIQPNEKEERKNGTKKKRFSQKL